MKGKLSVVGIGPGAYEEMTIRAAKTLQDCDLIVGYTLYVSLVREYFPEKPFMDTPMRREIERCRLALRAAAEGKHVALICSGDAGIYGLAGPVIALAAETPEVEVEIVPGVTAAAAGAARLGAPLTNDFAVISLSDLLTPREVVEERLAAAARADLTVVLYNPGSHTRRDALRHACDLLLACRSPETVCGMASRIGREGEAMEITTLGELREKEADMLTTVFVGNSRTHVVNGRMVTPRGYELREDEKRI